MCAQERSRDVPALTPQAPKVIAKKKLGAFHVMVGSLVVVGIQVYAGISMEMALLNRNWVSI